MGCSSLPVMPRNMKRIAPSEPFAFSCHRGVSCFTECCRMLELALSPYDVLRLRRNLGLSSTEVLDRYVIEEFEDGDVFPRYYLTMVDDGRDSCVFVGSEGCTIYEDRPGACRTYPLGRAVTKEGDGLVEHFVLIQEDHCLGFAEKESQSPEEYCLAQGLVEYNNFSDALGKLTMHEAVKSGFRTSPAHRGLFRTALYDIDVFRAKLVAGKFALPGGKAPNDFVQLSDEELLMFAIDWLVDCFFHPTESK